jgi:hypothetical protein
MIGDNNTMPTPNNPYNVAYNRLYKTNNALEAGQVDNGVYGNNELPNKGSVDLPAFPSIEDNKGDDNVEVGNNKINLPSMCIPYSL